MINISELSIRDWVKILPVTENLKEYNTQIKQLTYEEVHDSFYVEDEDNYVTLKYVEPISLTAEILKLNGFVSDACKCIWTYVENDINRYEMVSASNGGYWFGEFIKIQYVHELQRALRLCGLTDLADNFKV